MEMIKQLLSRSDKPATPQADVGNVDDLIAQPTLTVPEISEAKIEYGPEHLEHFESATIPHVSPDMRHSRFFRSLMARHPEAIDSMLDWV